MEGALARAAEAVEQRDARALYRFVDQRARHALHSILQDRREAAALVRRSYPPDERAEALEHLGDAARVDDVRALFAARCDDACLDDFGRRLAAPTRRRKDGDELVVTTARGSELRMYHGDDDWWGIVWRTEELDAERNRANRDLAMIERNAEVYARRKRLGDGD